MCSKKTLKILLFVLIVVTVAIFLSCLEWDTSSQEPPSRPFEPTLFHYFLSDQPDLDLTREQVLNKLGKQLATAYFYIHGFDSESLEKAESYKVKDAIFKAQPSIDLVVIVDWSKESSRGQFQYPIVAKYTVPAVALNVSQEILWISSNLAIPPNQIKMAGHSLGAHVMGIAGELLQKAGNNNSLIANMTGLDPAGPLFDEVPDLDDSRLSSGDATFVTCIYTDDTLGTIERNCDLNLYPRTPSSANCSVLDFLCRHSIVKTWFILRMMGNVTLSQREPPMSQLDSEIRGILETSLRKSVIILMYSKFALASFIVLYIIFACLVPPLLLDLKISWFLFLNIVILDAIPVGYYFGMFRFVPWMLSNFLQLGLVLMYLIFWGLGCCCKKSEYNAGVAHNVRDYREYEEL